MSKVSPERMAEYIAIVEEALSGGRDLLLDYKAPLMQEPWPWVRFHITPQSYWVVLARNRVLDTVWLVGIDQGTSTLKQFDLSRAADLRAT